MYQLSLPDPTLAPFIENYWFVTPEGREEVDLTVNVFVDGRADLIFNWGAAYERQVIHGESRMIQESNLDAQRLEPIRIRQTGAVHNLGVRFRLGGLGPFLEAHLADFTGKTPSLFEVFGASGNELSLALHRAEAQEQQVELLNRFFLSRLKTDGTSEMVRSAVAFIESRFGRGTVTELASALGSSERTLDRGFSRYLGFSPKVLMRIARFQFVLRRLMDAPEADLAGLSLEAGYFDQSHLIKDFRAMTGGVPRGYRGYYPKEAPRDFAPNVVAFLQDGDPEDV